MEGANWFEWRYNRGDPPSMLDKCIASHPTWLNSLQCRLQDESPECFVLGWEEVPFKLRFFFLESSRNPLLWLRYLLEDHVFEHVVPSWYYCLGRLQNVWEVCPSWRKWVTSACTLMVFCPQFLPDLFLIPYLMSGEEFHPQASTAADPTMSPLPWWAVNPNSPIPKSLGRRYLVTVKRKIIDVNPF